MTITIALFGDTATLTIIGLFLAVLGVVVAVKMVKIIWDMLPFL